MKVTKETPTQLSIQTRSRLGLRLLGLFLLLGGLLVFFVVRLQPLSQADLQDPSLLVQQQATQPEAEPSFQEPSILETGFKLANYAGRLIFTRERPALVASLLALVAGLVFLTGPFGSAGALFDKAERRVSLKQPDWFFRSRTESYPFEDICEIRVERDQATNKKNNYGVNMVIGHSEGRPLSRNYVYYKTVFPLSESFRYDYKSAQKVADRINTFVIVLPEGEAKPPRE